MFQTETSACFKVGRRPGLPYNEYVFVRFLWAMSTYAVLATLAAVTLDGKIRLATWIFLGGLAVKTVIAYKAPR